MISIATQQSSLHSKWLIAHNGYNFKDEPEPLNLKSVYYCFARV